MSEHVALITGGGRRIGAEIARQLHQQGYRVIIHYLRSVSDASQLTSELNRIRPNSAVSLKADISKLTELEELAQHCIETWGRLDVLINNASSYYPTEFGKVTEQQWEDLISSNAKAPFFLSQLLSAELKRRQGCIVNIVDIHAERPALEYSPYTIAKAGNAMMIKSLARELAPEVRVNGISPGVIIWPEKQAEHSEKEKQRILEQVPLNREGSAEDIARTVLFFVKSAPYITGQILAVDGGRSIYL